MLLTEETKKVINLAEIGRGSLIYYNIFMVNIPYSQ